MGAVTSPQKGGSRRACTSEERAAAVAEHPILHLSGCGTWRETSPTTQAAEPFLPELLPEGAADSPEPSPESLHGPKSPAVPRQQPVVGHQRPQTVSTPGKRKRADSRSPKVGIPGAVRSSPHSRKQMDEQCDRKKPWDEDLRNGEGEVAAPPTAARQALAPGSGRGRGRTAGPHKGRSKAEGEARTTKLTRTHKAELAARLATDAAGLPGTLAAATRPLKGGAQTVLDASGNAAGQRADLGEGAAVGLALLKRGPPRGPYRSPLPSAGLPASFPFPAPPVFPLRGLSLLGHIGLGALCLLTCECWGTFLHRSCTCLLLIPASRIRQGNAG